jgi:hypothetical protein
MAPGLPGAVTGPAEPAARLGPGRRPAFPPDAAPPVRSPGQGPIIGVTLNRELSRPNWYITSATRWMRTLSMKVG